MSVEGIDVLSVAGFSIFLLILLLGYVFVEMVFFVAGKEYWFRPQLEKNGSSLFDRAMHYVFWGIILNVAMVLMASSNPDFLKSLFGILESSGKLSEALKFQENGKGLEAQLVIFEITYFLLIQILAFMIAIAVRAADFGYAAMRDYVRSKKGSFLRNP